MKDVLQTIIENLVEEKEKIEINQIDGERKTIFEVKVSPKDMGKIIGKEGRIVKAIRTIFKAVGAKDKKRVTIEFINK